MLTHTHPHNTHTKCNAIYTHKSTRVCNTILPTQKWIPKMLKAKTNKFIRYTENGICKHTRNKHTHKRASGKMEKKIISKFVLIYISVSLMYVGIAGA